ncbi:MAG: hypothetical protein ACPGVP_10235 [Thiolinea sp.]
MTEQSAAQADNVTMSGGGLYSLATKGAKDVIDKATPRVLAAIRSLDLSESVRGFTMADMGCADGGTSLSMVRAALNEANTLTNGTQSTVVYADQPRNDFNALVSIIHGLTEFDSYLDDIPGVFPLFSGTSFYRQAVPDGTLDFGFSATAMHWLQRKPCNISDHVHMVGASGDELEQFRAQGKADWEQILMCRARELRSGGKLVLVNFGIDEQGRYLGNTGGVNMFDTFHQIWLEFLQAGHISADEYKAMTLPQYYNTVEEFSAPLTDETNPCYQAGLRLEQIETAVVPCPFAEEYKRHKNVEQFAEGLIPTIRSWNESIYYAGLDSSRSAMERKQLIEDYYGAYRKRVLENPDEHGMGYVHAYMTIARA